MDNYRVLIVDDEETLCGKQLATWVSGGGFVVAGVAGSQETAVELFEREAPHIVLMDIHLGPDDEKGGVAAARTIRTLSKEVQIIFVTGLATSPELAQSIALSNPVGFIRKPLRKRDVLSHLQLAVATIKEKRFLFVCYSHHDREMLDELSPYLNQLNGVDIEHWADTRIRAGDVWRQEIALALSRASAAIVLVTIDMMDSKFIRDVELPHLLNGKSDILVIPVFVGAVPNSVLQNSGLLAFRGVNDPADPLEEWNAATRRSKAWVPLFDRLTERFNGR